METVFINGAIGTLHISEPCVVVDNQARGRSGHMSHALVEYQPGNIIAFNSNCSAKRLGGHAAFGWIEYRYSDDYGQTWSEPRDLPYTKQEFIDGVHTNSVEKAVVTNGILTAFAIQNTQFTAVSCEPWEEPPLVLRSHDFGKTWDAPVELGPYCGRIYDAVVQDGVIYVLLFCNKNHVGATADNVYRLFVSMDNGASFQERSVIDIQTIGYAYGALQFRPDGSLIAYANNIGDGFYLAESVSTDLGKTWIRQTPVRLSEGIRNIQISRLGDGYVMHGRGFRGAPFGKGFVMYTSRDGLAWDDGVVLEGEHQSCYYSNNLLLKKPDGTEQLLVRYSDLYDDCSARVNVMQRFVSLEKKA